MVEPGLDELLDRARRRDPAALDQIVEIYSPRIFGLLYRLTRRRDIAEDLMQETFLRLVRMIDAYEHMGKFESWLFRIAANLARDRVRKIGRRGTTQSLDAPGDEDDTGLAADCPDEHAADPAERLADRETSEKLAACIDDLSEAEREIILLRHYSELSFREIAEMLGIPLGTALARAHRAMKRLQAALGADETGCDTR